MTSLFVWLFTYFATELYLVSGDLYLVCGCPLVCEKELNAMLRCPKFL
jgi:hypothetical protein